MKQFLWQPLNFFKCVSNPNSGKFCRNFCTFNYLNSRYHYNYCGVTIISTYYIPLYVLLSVFIYPGRLALINEILCLARKVLPIYYFRRTSTNITVSLRQLSSFPARGVWEEDTYSYDHITLSVPKIFF